jgi:N-terminal domain of toast_rack, DUF2154
MHPQKSRRVFLTQDRVFPARHRRPATVQYRRCEKRTELIAIDRASTTGRRLNSLVNNLRDRRRCNVIAKNSKGTALLAMVAILLAAAACGGGVRVGELRTGSEAVDLGGTTPVRVEIEMAAGELDVSGGAAKLLEADFTYNVAELKPIVDFSGGTLSVRTPDADTGIGSLWGAGGYRYEWSLRLNDDVPMEMQIGLGAGKSTLELGSLSLTKLDVAGGAGDVTVDLTGDWQNDLEATIEGGVGQRTLILPAGVGVRVKVEVGLGGVDATGLTKDGDYYVNDAYGQSDVTLNIQVDGGVGGTDLIVRE